MKLSRLEIIVNKDNNVKISNFDSFYESNDINFSCHGLSTNAFVYYPTGEREKYEELLINYCINQAQKEISNNMTIIENLTKLREKTEYINS